MRRIVLWAVAGVACALSACESPAEPAHATARPNAAVTTSEAVNPAIIAHASGAAHRDAAGRPVILNFSATKFADGTVRGEYYFRAIGTDPDQFLRVEVTCMTVIDGNKVWMGGITTDAFVPSLIGRVSYFYAFDNGEGAGDTDIVSRVRAGDVDEALAEFCDELPTVLSQHEVLRGNVNIEG